MTSRSDTKTSVKLLDDIRVSHLGLHCTGNAALSWIPASSAEDQFIGLAPEPARKPKSNRQLLPRIDHAQIGTWTEFVKRHYPRSPPLGSQVAYNVKQLKSQETPAKASIAGAGR